MKEFFNKKMGVTFDQVKTGPYADMLTVNRPLNTAEKQFIQNSVDTIYNDFKSRVAGGRKLSMAVVDSIAQGRVWTGQRALQLGLVDRLGSINDAVACASRMAKIKEYSLKEYPEKKSFLEKIVNDYSNEVKVKTIREEIGEEQYSILKQLKMVKKMIAIPQARLPFDINVQ
jgi:protease-4